MNSTKGIDQMNAISGPAVRAAPQPDFPSTAYGVRLTWLGEDGGMAAEGHVPLLRFVAACNRVARTECGLRNLADERGFALDDVLDVVRHVWAVTVPPEGWCEWAVSWQDVTKETPGAIPLTVYWP